MFNTFKKIMLWICFILFDFIIVAGICESWVRFFIPTMNICYSVDDTIGVTFCPNQRTYGYVEGDYSNIFITNDEGFHDYNYDHDKPDTVYRIHIYGDSMIQGKALQIKDTVTQIVQEYLNQQGFFLNFEVMNMASGDDSTSSQILTYQRIGQAYSPDLVLCYFSDDFGDNIYEVNGVSYSPYHKIDETGKVAFVKPIPKDTSSLWEKFKRTSRLYRLFANKLFESKFYHDVTTISKSILVNINSFNKKKQTNAAVSYKQMVKDLCTTKSWPLTIELLNYFNTIVTQHDSDFILIDGLKFNDNFVGETYTNNDLRDYCNFAGIKYVPVYPKHEQLKELKKETNYFFKDNHPTPVGNKKISLYLAEKINIYLKDKFKN